MLIGQLPLAGQVDQQGATSRTRLVERIARDARVTHLDDRCRGAQLAAIAVVKAEGTMEALDWRVEEAVTDCQIAKRCAQAPALVERMRGADPGFMGLC